MKKKHPEHVNLERWLVSYADFITLLFAFFVIMYAISQADIAKFKKVSSSIKAAFSSAGPTGMIDLGGNGGGSTVNQLESEQVEGGRTLNLPAGKTHTASDPDPELQEMKELMEETVSLEMGATELSDKMQMIFDSRGLVVRLAAKDFFEPGEAQVKPDLKPILDRIGRVVSRTRRMIRVEGHADPLEMNQAGRYRNAWEFSAARAANVVDYWVKRFELNPRNIGVAGYGPYRPLSEGQSELARGKNRRIEIVILNNQYNQ